MQCSVVRDVTARAAARFMEHDGDDGRSEGFRGKLMLVTSYGPQKNILATEPASFGSSSLHHAHCASLKQKSEFLIIQYICFICI